jgi:hypothetical protein
MFAVAAKCSVFARKVATPKLLSRVIESFLISRVRSSSRRLLPHDPPTVYVRFSATRASLGRVD